MIDSGIHISRATLTNWMQKGVELLKPIYQAQLKSILASKTLAMDEIAFIWSNSKGFMHAKNQLEGFNGVFLTDGYAAYT